MNRLPIHSALLLSLAVGCGAPQIDPDDQEAGSTLVTPELDDVSASTYVPDDEDRAVLDKVDGYGDDDLEQVFGLTKEVQRCRAMRLAKTQLGVKESGCDNCGTPQSRYTRHFYPNMGPQPWCAFFVSWAIDMTDNNNGKVPWSNPGYVATVFEWMRAKGRVVSAPQPCDMFMKGDLSHMGLVTSVNPKTGSFRTIEGNYSNQVAQVTRNYKQDSYRFARY